MSTIIFNTHDTDFVLKDKLLLKTFLASVFAQEHISFKSITYVFCSDEFLLKLNQQYLKHDTLTDILTFTLSGTSLDIVAEIYISVERVKENATEFNLPFLTELYRVMIHGVLHLCGYKDNTSEEKAQMRIREDFYLSRIL